MVKISLHVHTNNPYDGNHCRYRTNNSVENITEHAFRNNVGVVAITDENNNSLPFIKSELERFGNGKYRIVYSDDLLVSVEGTSKDKKLHYIKGTEIHHSNLPHLLGIGYNGELERDHKSIEDHIDDIADKNGIVIVPHPINTIRLLGTGDKYLREIKKDKREIFDKVTAIEGFNSQTPYVWELFFKPNKRASELAKELEKPHVSCADSSDEKIDRAYIDINETNLNFGFGRGLVESIRKNIAEGNFKNSGEHISLYDCLKVHPYGALVRVAKQF